MKAVRSAAVLGALALYVSAPAHAQTPAEFYAGRNVHLVLGYAPGGGYDLYARTLARHIGRHIPGKPNVVVQNMPGAGSLKAANFLYAVAPKDGSTFGGFSRGAYLDPLLGRGQGAQYEAAKFGWLGSISNEVGRLRLPLRRRHQVVGRHAHEAVHHRLDRRWRRRRRVPDRAAQNVQAADEGRRRLWWLRRYRGRNPAQRGRRPLRLVVVQPRELEPRIVGREANRVVLQLAARKLHDLPDVPLITEVTDNPDYKAALRLIVSRQTMARPYVMPPGVPADRLQAMRAAFDATMKDPAFLADAKRQDLEVRPVLGDEADALLAEAYATPPALVKLAVEFMTN